MPDFRAGDRWILGFVVLSCLAGFACSGVTSDIPGLYINISLGNSSSVALSVTITNTTNSPGSVTRSVPAGGATLVEVELNGASPDWSFDASGSGLVDGSATCTSTNAIIGTNEYGLVDMYVSTGTNVITVDCATGWQQGP